MHFPARPAIRRAFALASLTLALGGFTGCGEHDADAPFARRTTTVAELPENVSAAAKKELPDVDFSEAWKNVDRDDKLQSYEIRGRNKNGKIREVRVSLDGKILEKE